MTLADASAILKYVGTTAANPDFVNPNGVRYGSDLNANGILDGREYDRTASASPSTNVAVGEPNGAVTLADASAALNQVGKATCTPQTPATVYTYDANGNQTASGSDTFTSWDHENRLTSASVGGVTSSYTYNGDGLRVSRTSGGGSVSYVWDVGAGLPVILKDSANNYYVYGLDLISRVNGTTPEYYLQDGLGSTTELANGAGTVTGTYRYDVFGAVRSQTGSSSNEFTFAGDEIDPSGLQYLRARYYGVGAGRFLSRDRLPGREPYSYAANNPIRFTDPRGFDARESTRPVAGPLPKCPGPQCGLPENSWGFPDVDIRPALSWITSRTPKCYVLLTINVAAVGLAWRATSGLTIAQRIAITIGLAGSQIPGYAQAVNVVTACGERR